MQCELVEEIEYQWVYVLLHGTALGQRASFGSGCFVAFTFSRHLISWRQDRQCAFTVLPWKHGGMPRPKQMHIFCQLHEWSSPSKNDNDLKPEFQLKMDSDKHDHLLVCWRIRQKQFQTDIIIWPFEKLYSQSHYLITPFFAWLGAFRTAVSLITYLFWTDVEVSWPRPDRICSCTWNAQVGLGS